MKTVAKMDKNDREGIKNFVEIAIIVRTKSTFMSTELGNSISRVI